jgi:hypothetical protein
MSARQDEQGTGAGADWSHEHRFEVLVGVPEVKAAIERCAAQARVPMSAEEFLAKATMVLPNGAAIRRGGARGRALALRWGLRTGKSQETEINAPVGRVIACVLCSMVYHAQVVRSVEQREDGCTLIAEIPSDVKTYGGVLQVSIGRGRPGSTTVHATAQIPGQLYDWGKSKQTLEALFADVLAMPGAKTLGIGIGATSTATDQAS